MKQYLIGSALILLMAGSVMAQENPDSTTNYINSEDSNGFGEGVVDYSFSFDGLSSDEVATRMRSSPGAQIEAAEAITRPEDDDSRFRFSMDQTRRVARKSLGTENGANWELTDSERIDEGFYRFTFVRDSAEVDLTVDASSGRLTDVEGDWDKSEREVLDQSAVVLSGRLIFEDYFGHIDKKSVSSGDTVNFTLTVTELDRELAGEKTGVFQAKEEVEPGNYTVNLDIVQDGETVFEVDNRKVHVPSDTRDNPSGLTNKAVENMTYAELRQEVLLLREDKRNLEYQIRQLNNTVQQLRRNITRMRSEMNESRTSQETGNPVESFKNSGENRSSQSGTGNPENRSEDSRGVVDSILESIFG